MIPVILDCDNTMGLPGKDVDDGLALLYLLGSKNIELKAITTTFGNSTIEAVHPNTERLLEALGICDIPLYKGALSPKNRYSQAAEALVDMVNRQPHELTILAIGSPTNLLGAFEIDKTFFSKVKHLVMMGGIESPLIINGKIMNELNFSSDPEAMQAILENAPKTAIITGHVCLDAVFSHDTYNEMTRFGSKAIFRFIEKETKPWIDFIGGIYDMKGFHNWDAVAAAYIDHPELFDTKLKPIGTQLEDLKTGLLARDQDTGHPVTLLTKIKDLDAFNSCLIESWGNVEI